MIAELKPYPEMKDSGVEWLGEVPEHWKVLRLKSWLEMNGVVLPEDTDPDYMFDYLDIGSVATGQLTAKPERLQFENSPSRARRVLRSGDTIVSTVRTYLKAIWHVDDLASDLIASTGFAVLTPRSGTFPRFVSYSCQSDPFTDRVTAESVGIAYPAIAETRLATFKVSVPPLSEQTAIVRYLDYADRGIRRHIRAKQKLITLLEEYKQAIIHQAVTGQIDVRTSQPYPAYKPSKVEWLEEVPEHWEVIRFGRLITLTTGFPFKSEGFTQFEEDVRLLRGVNIAPGRLRWEEVVRWSATDTDDFAEYQLELGDIVLGMDRPIIQGGIRVAVVEQSDVPSFLLQRVARIHLGEELKRDFTLLLLSGKSFSDYLAPIFTGISVPHLSPEQIRGFRVALPSLAEQENILEQLRPSIGAIRSAMDRALSQILHLQEYRTRLLADVVTGKLDVREAASRLQDEADEPEPIDEDTGPIERGLTAPSNITTLS